jgi:hypothetical protein
MEMGWSTKSSCMASKKRWEHRVIYACAMGYKEDRSEVYKRNFNASHKTSQELKQKVNKACRKIPHNPWAEQWAVLKLVCWKSGRCVRIWRTSH